MNIHLSLPILLLFSIVHYGSTTCAEPKYQDLLIAANRNLQEIIKEYELEPLVVPKVEGVIPRYKYINQNVTLHGFKQCKVVQFEYNKEKETWQEKLDCPTFDLDFDFYVNGTYIGIQFDDQRGHISLKTGRFFITIIGRYTVVRKYNKFYFATDSPVIVAESKDKVVMLSNVVTDGEQSKGDADKDNFNGKGQVMGKEIVENILEAMFLKYFASVKQYLGYHCCVDLLLLESNYSTWT